MSAHQFQIARVVPSPRLSIGRPASSSRRGRAAAIIHNQERQRSSGTALGLRWGMYRTTCAVGTTGGRCARLGCSRRRFRPSLRLYDLLPRLGGGFGPRPFRAADGRCANTFLANIQCRRQGILKRSAERLPRHSQFSRLNAINLDRGGHDEIHEHSASGAANDR